MPSVREVQEQKLKLVDSLDALKAEMDRYEQRLNQVKNEIQQYNAKREEAHIAFEKEMADIEEWKRKNFGELTKREQEVDFREKYIVQKELEFKDKMIQLNRDKVQAAELKDNYEKAQKNTDAYFSKLKLLHAVITEEFKKLE